MRMPIEPRPWTEQVCVAGSEERERFLESHVALVRHIVLRMASRLPARVEIDDLTHDGIVGLLDATEKYNPSRHASFHTYAALRVRGAVLDGLRKKDWCSRSVRQEQKAISETIARLASSKGRPPMEEGIAEALRIDLDAYRSMLQNASGGTLVSIEDLPPEREPAETVGSHLPAHGIEMRDLQKTLAEAIQTLPERERRVVELYYHEELNMKEIGRVLGVSESRVCQLHSQAAARLRATMQPQLHAPRAPKAAIGCERIRK